MPKLEKVVKGLECCCEQHDGPELCEQCPYTNEPFPCGNAIMRDALALLRAQVPRVMTHEEIEQRGGKFNSDPVFVEWRSGYTQWVVESIGIVASAVKSEPEFVRVWTSRPTEEQRKAISWDERTKV